MKQVISMSRLSNQLEKMFRLLNQDFFDGELDTPIITVIPTSRAYAHYTPYEAWVSKGEGKREINIASGTLNRPLESICASLLHECVHMYNDTVLNLNDTSRSGTYHNKRFRDCAEAHGLIVECHPIYGHCITKPSDRLIEWLLEHDELREIEICRINPNAPMTAIGTHTGNSGMVTTTVRRPSNSRKYQCPCCLASVRATKVVHIACTDCNEEMLFVG